MITMAAMTGGRKKDFSETKAYLTVMQLKPGRVVEIPVCSRISLSRTCIGCVAVSRSQARPTFFSYSSNYSKKL